MSRYDGMGIEVAFVSAHGWRRLVYYVCLEVYHLEVARSDLTISAEAEIPNCIVLYLCCFTLHVRDLSTASVISSTNISLYP
jgi:hypothetical protein